MSVLHDALLHIVDMDILLHADVFLHKVFQTDVHTERNGPFKQRLKFLGIQTALSTHRKAACGNAHCGEVAVLFFAVMALQPAFNSRADMVRLAVR